MPNYYRRLCPRHEGDGSSKKHCGVAGKRSSKPLLWEPFRTRIRRERVEEELWSFPAEATACPLRGPKGFLTRKLLKGRQGWERDRAEARPVSPPPPPVQGKDPETSLCGMRGGEEEISKGQNPKPAKSSPEKPEGEKSRIREPDDEE